MRSTGKTKASELLIGAHTSASGGAYKALIEGQEIGATTIQLFTANQRRWDAKPLSDEDVSAWKRILEETGMRKVMSHDSYLINLGAPDPVNLEKSLKAFEQEIIRCQQLGLAFLNFHPGAALDTTPEECLERIVESLLSFEKQMSNSSLRLVVEATAGQGSCVGHSFEQLAYIVDKVHKRIPIGICIDTCHIFAAGYDLRTKEACDSTFKQFDKIVGLKHLVALHLNDSIKGLGSRVDRHAALGEGMIGIECFRFLMQDSRTQEIPKYLETPGGPPLWKEEIKLLRSFV